MNKTWKKGECGFAEGPGGERVIGRYVGLNSSLTKRQMASSAQDCEYLLGGVGQSERKPL